jgi:hypothetical protein
MFRNLTFIIFLFLIPISSLYSQDITIGTGTTDTRAGGGFFNYSDPTTLNIKVSVWGYVRYPGRYQIPIHTTPADLLSYAGGPLDGAELDDIRIYRVRDDGSEEIIKLNYRDLIYENQLKFTNRRITSLKASDILLVPGGPRYFFRDWLSITLSIFSALVSLTILIINISRN